MILTADSLPKYESLWTKQKNSLPLRSELQKELVLSLLTGDSKYYSSSEFLRPLFSCEKPFIKFLLISFRTAGLNLTVPVSIQQDYLISCRYSHISRLLLRENLLSWSNIHVAFYPIINLFHPTLGALSTPDLIKQHYRDLPKHIRPSFLDYLKRCKSLFVNDATLRHPSKTEVFNTISKGLILLEPTND